MIKNKIFTYLFLTVLVLGSTSCEDFFGDINENPNSPTDVPVDVLLPGIEVQLNYVLGGDFSRFTAVITQQTEGVARQWESINNYSFIVPSNFNTAWRTNLYAGVLLDLNILKEKAQEDGLLHYEGVSNVLLAYAWMMSTDVWGDIPYTEAFQGTDNITPVFDSQEFIYGQVDALLTDAKRLLAGPSGPKVPGTEDFLYGGDASKWLKFAYILQARSFLHRALVDDANYGRALNELGDAFESADDDARLNYGDGETSAAPWYIFNRDRQGDIEFHPTMRGIMEGLNDPRLPLFDQTFFDDSAPVPHPVMIKAQRYPFASYIEQKFIEAECLMQTNGDDQAIYDAYIAAVTASLDFYGVDGTDFLAQDSVDPGVGNVTMENIMIQKYIALWTEPEVFNDWRRNNIPELSPTSGTTVPVRFPYAETEILFNTNTPDVNIFTDKLWWDRN